MTFKALPVVTDICVFAREFYEAGPEKIIAGSILRVGLLPGLRMQFGWLIFMQVLPSESYLLVFPY